MTNINSDGSLPGQGDAQAGKSHLGAPNEHLMELGTFWAWLNALKDQWLIAMSGLFFVVIGVIEHLKQRPAIATRWYLTAVGFAFVIANYAAWAKLQPNIVASIQAVAPFDCSKVEMACVFIIVDVRNTGVPSIADYWTIYYTKPGGSLTPVSSIVPLAAHFKQAGIIFGPSEYLGNRTVKEPIPQGGDVKGFLVAAVPIVDTIGASLSSFRVTFNDVYGQTHWSLNAPYRIISNGNPGYTPGLNP